MRLERLTLAPYGRFADRVLNFRVGAGLHVVLGANESGKTTSLSAIGDLLFGFPTQTAYGFLHAQTALRVGGTLRLSDGSALELRRRKGNKNTLVDANDQPLSEDALRRALGGVDRKTFESEFGLTAQALREGGEALLRAGGGLAETLAAGSAGLSSLSRLRAKLADEADALFKTHKTKSLPFYSARDRYDEADKRLRDAIVTADALKSAETAVIEARAREIDLKARHEETGRSLARGRRAQRTRAKLARLSSLAEELAGFDDLPALAAATLTPWREALAEERALADQLSKLAADEARDEAAVQALGVDPELIARGPAIDELRERLGAVRKAKEDLPRRVEAHNLAQSQLDDLARRLGLADHQALLASPPTDPAIAKARALIAARRRAEDKQSDALEAHRKALAARDRLRATAGEPAADPDPLKRRLATLADAAADSDRLRRERLEHEREASSLAEETARLDPQPGGIEQLANLPLPEPTEVARHARLVDEAAEASRAAKVRAAAARAAAMAAEADLVKRSGESAGATRADWFEARARRESAFDRLGASLDGDAGERRERLETVRALAKAADATVEAVLADTARAARLQAARETVEARKDEAKRADEEASRDRQAHEQALADARVLWAASGLSPASPADMVRWRERATALLARRDNLEKRGVEIAALVEKIEGAKASLALWLTEAGGGAREGASFDEWLRAARAHLDALQSAWTRSREIEAAKTRAEKDATEAETALARETAHRDAHAAEWPAAMAAVGLAATTGIEEAEAALRVWESVALPREKMSREARSIEGIEDDIASFEAGVEQAAAGVAGLFGATAEERLARLLERLGEARRARDNRERLHREMTARSVERQGLTARRAALQQVLDAASRALAAPDSDALASTLDRLRQREALEIERAALRRDLAEIADGFDEAALRAEQADIDAETLPSRIEQAEQTQGQLLREIGEAAIAASEAKTKLDVLSRGRDAVSAARDRREAAGELVDISERWIIRQAAARLAARAIERHRAAAQDPLVERAGALFAVASAGAFAGLGADYDEADRPVLVARRADGERVKVDGLSEGARDQLFLSLRLALLERRAGEPLPFIGDDILASFDDERTRHTLALLAEFGKTRQAIVFTHHRHVADLARAAGGDGVDVMEI